MSALALTALLLAGPSPSASPVDERVVYEPEPEPESGAVEPKPESGSVEPEPGAPTPALNPGEAQPEPGFIIPQSELTPGEAPAETPVTPAGASPAAEPAPSVRLPLPPPPPPPRGNGRLVGGSITLALGIAANAAVAVEAGREDGNPQFVAATFIPLGLTAIGVGTYLLIRGAKARSNYLEWQRYAQRDARPSGEGLLVGGIMSTVIGGVTLITAAVQAREPNAFERPLVPTLFALGGVGVLTGVATITAGMLMRNRYTSWRQSTFLSVVPTIAPTRRGLSVGLVGRF